MKVLLTQADFVRKISASDFQTRTPAPTFNSNYLSSVLQKKGIETLVLDSFHEYISSGYRNPIDLTKGTLKQLEQDPDISYVGISVTSPTRRIATRLAQEIKKSNHKIKVIAGGPHITALNGLFLEKHDTLFDYLVIGEGDITFPQLINAIEGGSSSLENIPGIAIKKNSTVVKTESRRYLSENELNDPCTVPYTRYDQCIASFGEFIPSVNLITSRGCPFRCEFCYSPILWNGYREQSVGRVIDEIEFLVGTYGVKQIRFQDDSFTANKSRAIKIFNSLRRKNPGLSLYMHTRFDCIDEETVRSFAYAGGREIYFGLESGSLAVRRLMSKGSDKTNAEILEMCRLVRDYRIRLGLWVMIGYPGETHKDLQETIKLLRAIDPDEVKCNPAHVHPFTPLFSKAKRERRYRIEEWLGEGNDFFPYYSGKRGMLNAETCRYIERTFTREPIRTSAEYEYETTSGKVQ